MEKIKKEAYKKLDNKLKEWFDNLNIYTKEAIENIKEQAELRELNIIINVIGVHRKGDKVRIISDINSNNRNINIFVIDIKGNIIR